MNKLLAAAALALALVCAPFSSALSETLAERRFVSELPVVTTSAYLDQELIDNFIQWGTSKGFPPPPNFDPTSGVMIILEDGRSFIRFSEGDDLSETFRIPPMWLIEVLEVLNNVDPNLVFFLTVPSDTEDL